MLTDSRVRVPPLLSDLSLLFSPPSLCFEPSDSQGLAVTLGYNMLSPVEIRNFNSKGDHSWPLTPGPPTLLLPSIFCLHGTEQPSGKMGAGKVYSYSQTTLLPPPKKKRERKMNETHSSISRRWRRKPYWLKSKLRNREGKERGVPGKEQK